MTQPTSAEYEAKARSIKLVEKHVGLDPDEQVLMLVRKHLVVFRNSLLIALFIPFVLLFLVFFVNNYPLNWTVSVLSIISTILLIGSLLAFIVGTVKFLWEFHIWTNTFYVMTTKKLAIINHKAPWQREIQQISLNRINDVTLRQDGMEALLYGYSDVIAITLSGSTFIFEHVGHASNVQKTIMQQLELQKHPEFLSQVDRV